MPSSNSTESDNTVRSLGWFAVVGVSEAETPGVSVPGNVRDRSQNEEGMEKQNRFSMHR